MAQYPAGAVSVNPFRLVTKADAASATSLGSGTVSMDSGVADTYGSWTQLVASTAVESYITDVGIVVGAAPPTGGSIPWSIELGIGGAGSEVVKFEGLIPEAQTVTAKFAYRVPLTVPLRVTASKRIAARTKFVNSGVAGDLSVTVYGLPISQAEGN